MKKLALIHVILPHVPHSTTSRQQRSVQFGQLMEQVFMEEVVTLASSAS
jgi:hypothetical protein